MSEITDNLTCRIEEYIHAHDTDAATELLASALNALQATQSLHKAQAASCALRIYSDNPFLTATVLAEAVARTL